MKLYDQSLNADAERFEAEVRKLHALASGKGQIAFAAVRAFALAVYGQSHTGMPGATALRLREEFERGTLSFQRLSGS